LKGIEKGIGRQKGVVARSSGSRRLPFNIPFTGKSDGVIETYLYRLWMVGCLIVSLVAVRPIRYRSV